jgi:hypothetical protein
MDGTSSETLTHKFRLWDSEFLKERETDMVT